MKATLGGFLGRIPRPTPAMAVALLALLIAASGAAVAAIPSSDGTITACRDTKSGALRVIDAASQTCTSKETQLTWINGLPGSTVDQAANAANADKLDNKDSTDFYAAGSKVADADQLDGIDSSGFAKAYKRTIVVSPVGTDTENGQALLDAMNNITDASASKPYLLHIEPATYNLGTSLNTGSLNMKPFVDIEGSGELNTVITSGIETNCQNTRPGTVNGASNAEMRFLTVRNTAQICTAAISNVSASPRLTHLTAENTGGNQQENAVWNFDSSNPTMTDVTATTVAGFFNWAVYNKSNSSPTIRQSRLSGSPGALFQDDGGTARVALTQLVGQVQLFTGGSVQCFNNYDQNLAAVTCP